MMTLLKIVCKVIEAWRSKCSLKYVDGSMGVKSFTNLKQIFHNWARWRRRKWNRNQLKFAEVEKCVRRQKWVKTHHQSYDDACRIVCHVHLNLYDTHYTCQLVSSIHYHMAH